MCKCVNVSMSVSEYQHVCMCVLMCKCLLVCQCVLMWLSVRQCVFQCVC